VKFVDDLPGMAFQDVGEGFGEERRGRDGAVFQVLVLPVAVEVGGDDGEGVLVGHGAEGEGARVVRVVAAAGERETRDEEEGKEPSLRKHETGVVKNCHHFGGIYLHLNSKYIP
jgi:hypothetical protein